jgi:hypothetical protein
MTNIQAFTRLRGGIGYNGVYATATAHSGDTMRAFLAGEVLGTAVTKADAKNGRWALAAHDTPEAARAAFTSFFGAAIPVTAVAIDLTAGDIDRLKRGSVISGVYPLQDVIDKAAEPLESGRFDTVE